MPTIAEVREKFPEYKDLPDTELADKLHTKFYSDMPREEFDKKVGLADGLPPSEPSFGEEVLKGVTDPIRGGAQLLKHTTGIGAATAQPSSEGAQKEKKAAGSADSDEMTPGRMLGGFMASAPAGLGAASALEAAAPRIITPMTKAIAAGGVGGALQPATEGDDYWHEKRTQIGEGMVMGYGFSMGGKLVSKGLEGVGGWLSSRYPEAAENAAVAQVLKRMELDTKYNGAPNAQEMLDLVDAANARGKPEALIDQAGPNLVSLGGRAVRSPGESKAIAEGFLNKRDQGAPQRLDADVSQHIYSGPMMYDTIDGLIKGRSAAARPLYQETDKLQGIWSPRLEQFIVDPDIRKGMAHGYVLERRAALAEGREFNPTQMGIDLDAEGNIKLLRKPNMRVLDMAKQGLDKMIADSRDKVTGRPTADTVSLQEVKRAYVAELDALDKNGVYRKAREAWAGKSAAIDAVKAGNSVFSNSPDENRAMARAASPSDLEFMRIGMADKVLEKLSRSGLTSDESKAVMRSDWVKRQMQPLFKTEDDFNRYVESVLSEQKMASSKAAMTGGSPTAGRVAEDQSSGLMGLLQQGAKITKSAVQGNLLGVVGEFWRMNRDIGKKPNPAIDEHIAKLLFSPEIENTDLGQRLLKGPQAIPNPMAGAAAKTQDIAAPAAAAGAGAALRQPQSMDEMAQ